MNIKLNRLTAMLFVFLLVPWLFTGCEQARETEVKRLIGVSLANLTDEWRIVLKDELESEAERYEGLKLIFLDAGDNAQKQKNDLKELIGYGAELLIVSPVDIEELITPVEQMYYEGIPILLLDRAVKGFDYTCFFGVDDRTLAQKEAGAIPLLTGKGPDEIRGAGFVAAVCLDPFCRKNPIHFFFSLLIHLDVHRVLRDDLPKSAAAENPVARHLSAAVD